MGARWGGGGGGFCVYCTLKVQVYSWFIDMFARMTNPLLDIMTRVGKDGPETQMDRQMEDKSCRREGLIQGWWMGWLATLFHFLIYDTMGIYRCIIACHPLPMVQYGCCDRWLISPRHVLIYNCPLKLTLMGAQLSKHSVCRLSSFTY